MRKIWLVLCLLLVSCGPTPKEIAAAVETQAVNFEKIPALKDCTYVRIDAPLYIHVIRCPNSSTTTKTGGKGSKTVTTTE